MLQSQLCAIIALLSSVPAPAMALQRVLVNVSLMEEQPRGTLVANLSGVSGLPGKVRYQFTPRSAMFDVNASGQLLVKDRIDRDALCDDESVSSNSCTLDLSLIAEAGNQQQLLALSVTVGDENDNAPRFPSDSTVVSILENSHSFEVLLPVATDPDVDLNDVQEYRLLLGNQSLFELRCSAEDGSALQRNATSCRRLQPHGQSSPLRPALFIKSQTDRETQDSYELQLVALDGGRLSASVTVLVQVIDVNDHSPRFANSTYVFNVSESEPIGFELGQLVATDGDLDKNAEIDYRIVSGLRATEYFSLDFGSLRLNQALDYDKLPQYRFTVLALDGGQLSATASVIVNVLDANDQEPEVSVYSVSGGDNGASSGQLFVVENDKSPQRILGLVEGKDKDSDSNGNNNVTCSTESNFFYLVHQPATKGQSRGLHLYTINSRVSFDREQHERLEFIVTCTDSGFPALSGQALISVKVLDVNDNAPTLLGPSAFDILENSSPNTLIGSVRAVDLDQQGTENSTITYSITNAADRQLFTINDSTGELYSAAEFDRERRAHYKLNVTVSDHGSPPLNNTYEITVNVRDVNDNPPLARAAATVFNVREDIQPRSLVGHIDTDDADEANTDNSRVHYRLLTGHDHFMLTDDGNLFTLGVLDRENVASHFVLINLTNFDQSAYAPSSTATIRVNVLDVKDSNPRFLSRTQPIANVSCYETRAVEIAKPVAVDDDLEDSLTYAISLGNDKGHFSIDERTGTIRLVPSNWRCSDDGFSVYKLHVTATDSTGKSSVAIVDVLVTRDSGPKASSSEQHSVFSSEAVKIVIVLICASLVLATALIVVVLVFKVRPKRTGRYLQAAPNEDGVYPKPSRDSRADEPENHSDAHSSSEERYAAVIDDNNNADGNESDDNNDVHVHRSNEQRERLAKVPFSEKLPVEYDSASRCSSQLAALDNRSTLTRAADRELLYYTHSGKQFVARFGHMAGPHLASATAPLECQCVACQSAYATVSEYPYAATLARPIPPLPVSTDGSPSTTCTAPRRPSTRTLPRRFASTNSATLSFKQDHRCAEQHAAAAARKDNGQSVYGDVLYCSSCDAHAAAKQQPLMPLVSDAVIQLNSASDRLYGTHLRRPTVPVNNSVKSFVAKTANATAIDGNEQLQRCKSTARGDALLKQTSVDRSLTYFSPNKLNNKGVADATYGDHSKSSAYYSVSYV